MLEMTSDAPTNVGKRVLSNIASSRNLQNILLIGPYYVVCYDVTLISTFSHT